MLQFLLGLRANVAIAFFGAFAILVLIKLTSLLPSKYYFSFSKLYAGSSEPFIVDPPSVSAARLCQLMAKHNVTSGDLGRSVDCTAKLASGSSPYRYGADLFEKNEIDKIYSIALGIDSQVRAALSAAGTNTSIPPLAEEEFETILKSEKTVGDIYRRLLQYYDYQIANQFSASIRNGVDAAFAGVRAIESPSAAASGDASAHPDYRDLTDEEITAARQAHKEFLVAIRNENLGSLAEPLTKSSVDRIIGNAYGASAIASGVTDHYAGSIKQAAGEMLRTKFADAGIKPIEPKEAKELIFSELVKDGLFNYVVATIVRLLPVLVFGIVLGFIFGRQELFSTSFAGAMAAFLLTWPIMLMWDRVVQGSWHDQKEMFLIFYCVYIISFFLTARVGALIGIRMSEGAPEPVQQAMSEGRQGLASLKGTTWAELVGNIVIGIIANGVVAAWNVIIPANAG